MPNKRSNVDSLIAPAFHAAFRAAPITLVDVGARGGVQEKWQALEPCLKVIGFEPDAEEHARLSRNCAPGMRFIHAALGRGKEVRCLNITRSPGCSSFLTPNAEYLSLFVDSERFDVVKRADIEITSLDRVTAVDPAIDVDFLKLDTQGFEFDILAGAEETLGSQILGLEIEVLFQPMYENQTCFRDVDAYLAQRGFTLFDLRPYYWKRKMGMNAAQTKGAMIFADSLYFRAPESDMSVFGDRAAAKVLHLAAVYLVFGYLDCALAVLKRNRGLLDEGLTAAIPAIEDHYAAVAGRERKWRRHRLHEALLGLERHTDTTRNEAWSMTRLLGNVE